MTLRPADLLFNVLYTPDTVEPLRRLVPSWLRHTGARFRLVANGLPRGEARRLELLAETSDRLLYHRLEGAAMLPHGEALSRLHALAAPAHFCFMDSDIFAAGDFVAELLPHLAGNAAFFSGAPIWAVASDQVCPRGATFCGPHHASAGGVTAGSSYFAVYDQTALAATVRKTGIGFDKVLDWQSLAGPVRAALERMDCVSDRYEAGKLLNILLQAEGHSVVYRDLAGLRHVGGLSLMAGKARAGAGYVEVDAEGVRFAPDFSAALRPWIPRKRLTCRYIGRLLAAALEPGAGLPGGAVEPNEELLLREGDRAAGTDAEIREVRARVLATGRELLALIARDRELFVLLDAARRRPSFLARLLGGLGRGGG